MRTDRHIYLVGFMGCGKSTVSKILAEQCDMRLLDTDSIIAGEQNMKIPDIFEQYGEEYFRNLETELLEKLVSEPPAVIACGGGMAIRERNIELMKASGKVIMLTATPETIYERVRYSNKRPILNGNMNVGYIRELMDKRTEYYNRASDARVATDGQTPWEIVQKIVEIFRTI